MLLKITAIQHFSALGCTFLSLDVRKYWTRENERMLCSSRNEQYYSHGTNLQIYEVQIRYRSAALLPWRQVRGLYPWRGPFLVVCILTSR